MEIKETTKPAERTYQIQLTSSELSKIAFSLRYLLSSKKLDDDDGYHYMLKIIQQYAT